MEGIIKGVEVIIVVLIGVAYLTLGERKVMGAMQRREGPNIVGVYGILQPIMDGAKLFIKEIRIPGKVTKSGYIMGPILTWFMAMIIYIPIPINNKGESIQENEYGIIYILAISTLSVYILLYAGWSSNSKYTILGAIRAIAQMISYEVSLGIIIMSVIFLNYTSEIRCSWNLIEILYTQIYIENIFLTLPIGILFLLSSLAETNRPPFDLPEAESELVAGVLTEYGGMAFAALYLAEYAFVQSMSILTAILFFGEVLFTPFIIFFFIWARASLPRVRYDQLIKLGWTKILPFSIAYLIWTISLVITI